MQQSQQAQSLPLEVPATNYQTGTIQLECFDHLQTELLKWLKHLGRVTDDRLSKKLLFCRAEAKKCRGHSRKGWRELLQSDPESIYTCYHWYADCQNLIQGATQDCMYLTSGNTRI